ncbi:cupin domain-containing protein [Nocardia sp. NBC_01009]|uniref:cupin domain-containing protein n=1 Tax=Nocardia sp. NBC_01009 TaxID=2975996 RepID=UPI003863E8EB|nr:cupin domain-containing protein [Nocardia sp. NBC_01009]
MTKGSDESAADGDNASSGNADRMNRRTALGAGAVALGAGAVGAGAVVAANGFGAEPEHLPVAAEVDNNLAQSSHLFKLTSSEKDEYDGGYLQGATEESFPVLLGQQGAVYFVRLEVGGMREPHWHPTAWELNFIVAGRAKWTILGTHPGGAYRNDVFEADQGDLVFAPQGYFHYFENARTDMPLEVLIVFNTSAKEPNDDIGIVGALNSLPRDVLATAFGIPVPAFDQVPHEMKPVVITRRR